MKRILLIATGGTIASLETGAGLSPGLSSEELKESVPELSSFCYVDTLQLLNIDSTNIQPEHWLLIAGEIEKKYFAYDGFVITHGTDTMAYTSAALSYLIQNPDKPIVLTGSQKPLRDPISDARKNLLDSFRFACTPGVFGVYIVFSGSAILGTRAKKLKTKSFSAFSTINYPEAAAIEGRRVLLYIRPEKTGEPIRFYHGLLPEVFLLKLVPGMEPDILDYIGAHYRAVVLETYGVGGIPFADRRNFLRKLDSLQEKGCVAVISTQAMLEGSDAMLYEVGQRALREHKLLQSYDMTTEAVVTKLMWLLGLGLSGDELRAAFYCPVSKDILFTEDGTVLD